LFLVLVPRHFERRAAVSEQLRAIGVTPVLRSEFNRDQQPTPMQDQCLLVGSTGELTAFYAEADVVFVGKSLCARGGQNPIEPAALGKVAVFGPNMQNFPGVTQQLVSGQAAIQISDEAQLEQAISKLLRAPDTRSEMGRKAIEIVHQNQGATRRTVGLVVDQLEAHWAEAKNR